MQDNIKKVAQLARIAITESEIIDYNTDFLKILAFIEQMHVVKNGQTASETSLDVLRQLFRHDQVTETNQRNLLQALAPAVAEGFYLVPQVIE